MLQDHESIGPGNYWMQLLRNFRQMLFRGFFQACCACHWLLGSLRRLRSFIRATWPGNDPLSGSRQHAVYVHYDRKGVIHDYVIGQLQALKEAGFRITFVSNSPKFSSGNIPELVGLCRQIIWRRNVGYDFGGYKDGVKAIGNLELVDRLLLMNDSVYGPFFDLPDILSRIDTAQTDVWGITDSWQHHYHVQSYFILFFRNALRAPAFQRFWRHLPYVNWKTWIIFYGEIKLTHVLAQQKLRINVLAPYWEVAKATLEKLQGRPSKLSPTHSDFLDELQAMIVSGKPMNPSHIFCEPLLTEFNCPFLKREAIVANPLRVPFIWRWDEALADVSDYDPDLIRRHLQAL
jgi:lipopolysaccharide biosynthesis protein